MSFWGIIGLVILAVIILSFIFAMFHVFFLLLPAILIIAGLIWLINHFTKKDDDKFDTFYNNTNFYNWRGQKNGDPSKPKRKKARNVKTKDVNK